MVGIHRIFAVLSVAGLVVVAGCSQTPDPAHPTTGPTVAEQPASAHASCSADVVTTPVPQEFAGNGFDRYYELVMDGQVVMRYLIRPGVDQAQLEHIVRTTKWYLTDVPGSKYGADKSVVRAKLAENKGTMVIPQGTHQEGKDIGVQGQELYSNEVAAPGSAWYLNNDPEHRDATLEEVFHQVHDNGIGTTNNGALPQYQDALLAEAKIASTDGRWADGDKAWIDELTKEGSLAQEYIASVIDNYYGLWGHSPDGSGYYAYNTRQAIEQGDPKGVTLLSEFLGPDVLVEAYLDPTFDGTFEMTNSNGAAYGHKSQYLQGARLTGSNAASITGNALDNTLRGNSADNTLDGGDGTDTVIYCAPQADYTIDDTADGITITGPDGTDTLRDVEAVQFQDVSYTPTGGTTGATTDGGTENSTTTQTTGGTSTATETETTTG